MNDTVAATPAPDAAAAAPAPAPTPAPAAPEPPAPAAPAPAEPAAPVTEPDAQQSWQDTMRNKYREMRGDQPPEPPAPAGDAKPQDAAAAQEPQPAPAAAQQPAEGDAAKPTSTDQPGTPDSEQTAADTPAGDAIAMPVSWSAEKTEIWSKMDPQAQEYVSQRELEQSRKISEQGNELGRTRPVMSVIQQFQQNFDRHGVSVEEGIAQLMAAQDALDRNPLQAIHGIAETFGIDLAAYYGAARQALPPEVRQMQENNYSQQALIETMQRDEKARAVQAERVAVDQERQVIAEWAADKPHYETVRNTMANLIQTGEATSYDDAYQKACLMNPEIRQQMEATAAAERQRQEQAQQQAAAEAARLADEKAVADARRMSEINVGRPQQAAPTTGNDIFHKGDMAARLRTIRDRVA